MQTQSEDSRQLDIESGTSAPKDTEKPPTDPNLVTWEGPTDSANPKNWTTNKRMIITVLVSLFTFMSPISSSMVAPALSKLGEDLGMHEKIEVEMALSIFILGYAIGPLFFGPLSEIYGRYRVLLLSNLFYVAWNTGCGFAQNKAEFFVFRFLAGIGGSAPLALGGGAIRQVFFNHCAMRSHQLIMISSVTCGGQRNAERRSAYTAWALCLGPPLALSVPASSPREQLGAGASGQQVLQPPLSNFQASFGWKRRTHPCSCEGSANA